VTIKNLYISDLDGTLLNSEKKVSQYTKETLNALIAKGMHFTIATARTAASSVKILSGVNINLPVILMNGTLIYDMQNDVYLNAEIMNEKTVSKIIRTLRDHNINGFMYALIDNKVVTYYENLSTVALQDFHTERVANYFKSFEKVDCFLNIVPDNDIIYFTLIDEQKPLSALFDSLKKLPDVDAALYKDTYSDDLWYLEIHSISASKFNAVNFVRDYCKFEKIIGFGDNYNDLPFLEACDEFYAVANSVVELSEKASGVIGGNNSDGVAKYISDREEILKP